MELVAIVQAGGSERRWVREEEGEGVACLLVKMLFLKCNFSALQPVSVHVCLSVCV